MKSNNILGLFKNKNTLDKFSEQNGKLNWNGAPIRGESTICPYLRITVEDDTVITAIHPEERIDQFEMTQLDEHTYECRLNYLGTWTVESLKDGVVTPTKVEVDEIKIYYVYAGNINSTITVTYPENASCRCVLNGSAEYATESPFTFTVTTIAKYKIETIDNEDNVITSREVIISESGQHEELTITFGSIIVNYSDEFRGVRLTCSNGAITYEKICPDAENTVKFTLPGLGKWTIENVELVNNKTYTKSVVLADYINYNIPFKAYTIYGFSIASNQDVSYHVNYNGTPVDNYDYEPAKMESVYENPNYVFTFNPGSWDLENDFFVPRSCMVDYNGNVLYYLNENDHSLKEDGSASDVGNPSFAANAMMEFGRDGKIIWIKVEPKTNDRYSANIFVADEQVDDKFICWPFISRHDASKLSHFYYSKYDSSLYDNKLRSLSGRAPYIHTFNELTSKSGYGNNLMEEYCDRLWLNVLFILIFGTLNSQDALGVSVAYLQEREGYVGSINTGMLDKVGMFYGEPSKNGGPYVDTNIKSVVFPNFHSIGRVPVKFLGIENFYGNDSKYLLGFVIGMPTKYNQTAEIYIKPIYKSNTRVCDINAGHAGFYDGYSLTVSGTWGLVIGQFTASSETNNSYQWNRNYYSACVFDTISSNFPVFGLVNGNAPVTKDAVSFPYNTNGARYPVSVGGTTIGYPYRYGNNSYDYAYDNGILSWSAYAPKEGIGVNYASCFLTCKKSTG